MIRTGLLALCCSVGVSRIKRTRASMASLPFLYRYYLWSTGIWYS